jgi:hypothetical protein
VMTPRGACVLVLRADGTGALLGDGASLAVAGSSSSGGGGSGDGAAEEGRKVNFPNSFRKPIGPGDTGSGTADDQEIQWNFEGINIKFSITTWEVRITMAYADAFELLISFKFSNLLFCSSALRSATRELNVLFLVKRAGECCLVNLLYFIVEHSTFYV